MSQLGLKIKKLREDKLLSRKELAKILKCSVSHAINIEKEKNSAGLSQEKKDILTKYFDLPVNYFNTDDTPAMASDYDHQIGQNIKKLRLSLGLTQTEFAEEVGYSGSAPISALESGKRSISKKKIIEVADFFGVHVAEILSVPTENFRQELQQKKLISDFYFILEAKIKPTVFKEIKNLIAEGCKEIRSNTL